MSEVLQVLITTIITILTIVLSLVGIQVVYVLKELHSALKKLNHILADGQNITAKISHSTDSFSGMVSGLKAVLALFGTLQSKRNNDDKRED